ncbi:MAG: hypothetical protein ACR2FG_09175 [Marmoricola sp.]
MTPRDKWTDPLNTLPALRRGLVAGAVGTTVINAVAYLDMAARGRPPSEMPRQTVASLLDRLDVEVTGSQEERANRGIALGALAGIAAGLGVGAGVSCTRSLGLRLSPFTGAALTAAAAMAATDGPAALLGVSDPGSWTAEDWASDVLPHLAYGVVTHQVVRALETKELSVVSPSRPSAGLLFRSLLLGVATGSRSSLGLAGAAFTAPASRFATIGRAVATVAVGAELVVDKLPQTPSRLEREGLGARFGSAVVGATALASRENAVADLPVALGAVGAAVGAFAGAAWREASALSETPAALIEDVAALGLARAACRRRRA